MRIVPVLLVAALAACSSKSSSSISDSESRQLLIDRNWLDKMPETERDRLHVYRFVPSMGGGVFQDRTLYKGTFELFVFKVDGDHIDFNLPETHEKVRSQFHIEKIDGPAPFDLKLTIGSDPRGPSVYYGIRSETDRDGKLLEQELAAKR
ncbi:MAG: uncharacterized protein JWO36_2438 [Myxococcales bacterium]|nr:uncharacterized protein [Myxococcales bacterium]